MEGGQITLTIQELPQHARQLARYRFTVESEKGKGSTFTVDLDLHISEQAMDRSFWKNNGITRLLAVGDEEDVVKNIRLTMKDTGVSVDCALNGQAAVHLVTRAAQEGRHGCSCGHGGAGADRPDGAGRGVEMILAD